MHGLCQPKKAAHAETHVPILMAVASGAIQSQIASGLGTGVAVMHLLKKSTPMKDAYAETLVVIQTAVASGATLTQQAAIGLGTGVAVVVKNVKESAWEP